MTKYMNEVRIEEDRHLSRKSIPGRRISIWKDLKMLVWLEPCNESQVRVDEIHKND